MSHPARQDCASIATSHQPKNQPSAQRQDGDGSASQRHAAVPPYSAYLQLVSFTAAITISVSISSSQGFATSGNFLGVALDGAKGDPITTAAITQTTRSATWLTWSAAASALSLMITLTLQLLLTDDEFVLHLTKRGDAWWRSLPRVVVGAGSWVALALQGTSLGLIGQALKPINARSGAMIQVRLPMALHE